MRVNGLFDGYMGPVMVTYDDEADVTDGRITLRASKTERGFGRGETFTSHVDNLYGRTAANMRRYRARMPLDR